MKAQKYNKRSYTPDITGKMIRPARNQVTFYDRRQHERTSKLAAYIDT